MPCSGAVRPTGILASPRRVGHPRRLAGFLTEAIRCIPGIDSIRSATLLDVVKDSYLWDGFRQGS